MKKHFFTLVLFLPQYMMAQSNNNVTVDLLQSFANAFNAHDIKAIMFHMTEDCVFEASSGPDAVGKRYIGQDQVRKAFEEVFSMYPDARWDSPRHFVLGDRGFSEWVFSGTKKDGSRVEVTGCDLFTFMNGKIAIKNSYRKNRLPVN
jgi:ketosteroid isomerase-like protein